MEDALVSAAYRRRLAGVTLRRALAEALTNLSGAAHA
jgi:CO/xanthine dehydrogenase FAD-binding subunit